MEKARWVPVLLAAVCAVTPVAGFLPELLLQPLQEVKHAFQPQPQYYQYYRRTVHDQPQQGGYPGYAASGYNGYANPRPAVYQWSRPTSYDVGSGYSYSSNPLTSFLQSSWMPWSNRPSGLGQQYGLFSQPALQQQQPQQQPLQALWATLPWGGSSGQQTTGSVLGLLPWSRPSGSAVHYVPPLVPTATSTIHVMAPQSAAVSPSEATLTAGVKPVDSVAMEPLVQETTAELADNAIRRLAMQAVRQDETPCA